MVVFSIESRRIEGRERLFPSRRQSDWRAADYNDCFVMPVAAHSETTRVPLLFLNNRNQAYRPEQASGDRLYLIHVLGLEADAVTQIE